MQEGVFPAGAIDGLNSAGRTGYIGPCPPSGTHRYIFTLYALDARPDPAPGPVDAARLRLSIEDHVVATAMLTGTYTKQK